MNFKRNVAASVIGAMVLMGCGAESTVNVKEAPDPALTGVFVDSPVAGLGYRSESVANGTTNSNGEYSYFRGETITFFIGDFEFPGIAASSLLTPLKMFEADSPFKQPVANAIRLLQALDVDGDPSNGIEISPAAASAATMLIPEGSTVEAFFNRPAAEFAADVEPWLAAAGGSMATLAPFDSALEHFVTYLETEYGTLFANTFDISQFNGTLYNPVLQGDTAVLEKLDFTPTDSTNKSGTFTQLVGEDAVVPGTYEFVFGRRAIKLTTESSTSYLIVRSYNTVNMVYSLCSADGSQGLATAIASCDADADKKANLIVIDETQAATELEQLTERANTVEPALNEEFDTDTTTFFSSGYKRLTDDPNSGAMYFKTGGSPALDAEQGNITLAGDRFSIGNAAANPLTATTANDTLGTGIFNISQGFTISFDVVTHNGAGSFNMYVDNNTTGQDNSVQGAASKFYGKSINAENLPIGQRFSYTYVPGTDVSGLDPSDPTAKILNPAVTNSFFQFRTDSAASITIDNLKIETVADSVPVTEPEEPTDPEEPEVPAAIPRVNLPFNAGFAGVTDDIFSSVYSAIQDSTGADVAMFTKTGGSVVVVDNGIELDGGRFSIGNATPGTNTTPDDTSSTGVFDLSRPYNVLMDIVAVEVTDETKKLQIYVDNSTSGSANSMHGGDSRIYNELGSSLVAGTTLTVPGLVGTKNSFLQIRTETGVKVVIDNIRIEYLNENLLTSEDFNTTSELFFTAEYKALPGDAATELYHVTGGASGLTITDGQLKIDQARFTLGNTTPATNTTADDTVTTGIYDLSRPYQILFDVVATEDTEGNNNLILYVDNNTSSSGSSIHGGDSKFYAEQILSLVPGETVVVDGLLATQTSFLQFRTESGGSVTIDNLRIEYLAEEEPGAKAFSCADAPELYFCDDFSTGSTANYQLLATADNTEAPLGFFDTVNDIDDNPVLRYNAGGAGGEILLLTDAAMANVPVSGDYFVEARIRPRQNSTTANKQLFLLGRYDSAGNWYGGGLNVQNSSSSTQVEVAISTNGSIARPVQKKSPILLGEKDGAGDGVWYTVRFEMIGSDLTVYLDGELMGTTSDATYTTKGLIGLFTNNRSFELDDIKVGDPSVKPVQLTLDYKSPTFDTSTTADPLVINITALQSDGVTADTFTVKSSDTAVVNPLLEGNVLTLQALSAGTSTIYIKSGSDKTIVRTIEVTVAEGFVMPTQSYGDFGAKVTPAIAMTDEYIDASLSITFDSAPTLGTIGEVRIFDASNNTIVDTLTVGGEIDALGYAGQDKVRRVNVDAITLDGSTMTIKPHNNALEYGQTYYVVIGDDVAMGTQLNGIDFVGLGENANWYFSTKASAPSTTDLTVDDDGDADFRTVQGALNYTMQHIAQDTPSTIMVKDGVYNEMLYLRNKNYLTIEGESRENTIIQYDNYETRNGGSGTSEAPGTGTPGGGRSVFLVEGADLLTLTKLTLKNSHMRSNLYSNQAETIYFNSAKRLVARDANFISEQDTLLLKGYPWFYNTLVAGNVDFIWGYPVTALFEESEIRTIGDSKDGDPTKDTAGGYVLQARVQNATDPGFIFLNSQFTHGPGPIGNDVLDNSTYIARSGGSASYFDNVTLINNKFDTHIATSGWAVLGVNGQPAPNPAEATATSGWREYGSMDMQGNPLDLSGRVGGYVLQTADVANLMDRVSIFASYDSNAGWDPMADNTPVIGQILTDTGFAGYNFDLTGGAGGIVVAVNNGVALINALKQAKDTNMPITVYVDGTITDANSGGNGTSIDIKDMDNVSIIGVADRGEFDGIGIQIRRANNIIIQNLKIHHVLTSGKDGISIEGDNDGSTTSNIWIDHNELYSSLSVDKDYYDGLIDSKSGAENITISYNYLHDHWKASLHGHTEEDTDSSNTNRNITFHHNRFEDIESRLPLFRYGHGHLYNNYYNNIHSTAMNSRIGAELLIENNVFENTQNPIVSFYSEVIGYWNLAGNVFGTGVTWTTPASGEVSAQDGVSTSSYVVPYDYELEAANVVKANVINLSGIGKLDQSGLDIPDIADNGTPSDTDVSLPFSENFNAADAATLFTADYKNIPGDSTSALYNITGGGSGITISDGQISLASARFTIGHSTPEVATTADDTAGAGVFDLSKPYKIVMDIISVGGADGTKDFQVYVDNNTSGSSNSIHGGASKFYAVDSNTLTPGTLEIEGLVATENSFIQIRTETGATVVIDNLRIEYLPSDAVLSEDFTADDAATLFTPDYKALPDDAATAMYFVTGGGSGITITDGQISLASARFTAGAKTPGVATTADDVAGAGVFDLSKPYKIVMDIISVGGADGTKDFQVYVDNNTSGSSNSIHGGASKFYAVDSNTLTPGTLEIEGLVATENSFIQIRTETGATVVFDNLRIEYTE